MKRCLGRDVRIWPLLLKGRTAKWKTYINVYEKACLGTVVHAWSSSLKKWENFFSRFVNYKLESWISDGNTLLSLLWCKNRWVHMDSDCFSALSSKHFSSLQWPQAQNYNKSLQSDLNRSDCSQHRIRIRFIVWFSISDEDVACHLSFPIHLPSCSFNVSGIKYFSTCF